MQGIVWPSRLRSSRWVADALKILDSPRSAIDWPRLVDQAVEGRVAPHLRLTLSYLRDAFEAPVPSDVVEELRAQTTPIGIARVHLSRGRALFSAARSA